jgi:hypothetical protein
MGNKPFTLIAALIFLVVAVLHVIRLVKHFHVVLGSHMIPMWVSWLGVIIPLILVWGLWRESRR